MVKIPEPETPEWAKSLLWIWHHIQREGSVIRGAPGAFALAVLVVGGLEYWFLGGRFEDRYSGQISELQATIQSDDAALKFQDERLAALESHPTTGTAPNQSSLQFADRARLKSDQYVWNTYFVNRGTGAASGAIHADVGVITDGELPTKDLDKAFRILNANLQKIRSAGVTSQTQAGGDYWYTTATLVPRKFDGNQFGKPYVMTSADFDNQVLKGGKWVYWFTVLEARDDDLPPGKWRVTEVCGYGFANNADHICPTHNDISISD